MAKKKNLDTADTEGRAVYYDELHFIKTKDKNEYWAAQVLYFNKMIAEYFVDPKEVKFFRDLEMGKIDEALYRQFIDPKMPNGDGGKAEYFKANWQTNPIYMHLENIKEAQLKKLPLNIVCKASDEFSKLKQQEDNDKIIGAQYMRQFLNEINPQFGIRKLNEDEDPFSFISKLESSAQQPQPGGPQSPASSNPMDTVEAIKSQIFNNKQLAIYNQYLYKDGVEVALEIGIKEYIESINKFRQAILPRLISDVKNFNAHIFRHFTSETTGRPIVTYEEPHEVRIGPCKAPDLSDNTLVIKEFDTSFGTFVQMAGADLKPEMLKEIFIKNRSYHNVTGDYEQLSTFQRNSARIRLGYHEFETQNMDVYTDYITKQGNKVFKKVDDDYHPTEIGVKEYQAKRVEKHYNVWYSFYYIPLDTLFTTNGTTSFKDQAKYIFKFGPIQDQVREGDDFKYAKGTFCGYRIKRFSFAKIEHSFMPEIIKLWHLFQNDISSSMSDGVIWAEDLINSMMKYIDTGKGMTPVQKKLEVLRMLRQTNSGIGNFETEIGEGGLTQRKLYEKVSINSLETAGKRLEMMMLLYEMLTKSLGFNEIAEGQSPQPRQNLGGINLSMMASSNASYTMEESITASYLTLGERMMYYIKDIVDEGDSERLKEFTDMVGYANSLAAQSIKDIPMHRLYLHLENQMTDEQKAAIMNTANELAKAGLISPAQVLFLAMVENVKYAYAILSIWIEYGQKQAADSQDAARKQTRDDQLFASNLKIQEIHAGKADDMEIKQMMQRNEALMIQLENNLKLHGQLVTKDAINDHRVQQSIIDNKLQQDALEAEQKHSEKAS